ncbi:nucleoside diphosphate kinase, mitochondrial [Thalassophryne amazonica]|uniref:nucleoside diphosphate kinase, mitochondrial n=1 Tax=Thalassophryne amazonica TaxID=390379 RepID=UPI001472477E|nr:nucleoside diphosphate kinase, mitochondrial [Thalassophryne amazonica]
MIILQRCALKGLLQRFYFGTQTAYSSVSAFPSALLDGHRSKSTVPDVAERTLIAVKPDGVQRRLVGQIIQRFERRGFKLVGLKMLKVSEELLSQHYSHLKMKSFFPSVLQYMTSAPVVVMVWEGYNVVQTCRAMVGHTNPAEAQAGTVRGDFGIHVSRNVVHASDSLEGAQKEIQLWFQGQELLNWESFDHNITIGEE